MHFGVESAELKARPFDPLVFSRNVDVELSAAILVMRFARVSVNRKLPSGAAMGPSVPSNPSRIDSTFVPAAITPGMAGATASAAEALIDEPSNANTANPLIVVPAKPFIILLNAVGKRVTELFISDFPQVNR